MLNLNNPLEKQHRLETLYEQCQAGDMEACRELSQSSMSIGMAEGGEVESLLGAPPMREEVPPLAGLRDIIGDESFSELQLAIEQFPVVGLVAEMATYQGNGEVEGMGTSTSDSVPARLSEGEFVFSAEAVDAIGVETLERIHEEAKQIARSK